MGGKESQHRRGSLFINSFKKGENNSNFRVSPNLNGKIPKPQKIKVEDLDINKVIDSEKAIKSLGDFSLYKMMLPQYESSSQIPYLEKMA